MPATRIQRHAGAEEVPERSGSRSSATDLGGLAASETFNIVVATPPSTVSLVHRVQCAGADQSE